MVIIARAGLVSTAEANGCPVVPVSQVSSGDPQCRNTSARGVQFDFSAPGQPWYRITVLASQSYSRLQPLQPMAFDGPRLVRADGATIYLASEPGLHLAVLHADAIAKVRVQLTDGGQDAMTPVDGWVAFAAATPRSHSIAFGLNVKGLDNSGQVVATAAPFKCC